MLGLEGGRDEDEDKDASQGRLRPVKTWTPQRTVCPLILSPLSSANQE